MYTRPSRTQTLTPSNIELEEKKLEQFSIDKDKKRKRFKSPMSATVYRFTRSIFKSKNDDDSEASYYRLEEKEQQYSDLQFKEPPTKIPIHAIVLAAVLFLLGSVMITLGTMMLTGYIKTQYSDRSWPLILIGSMVFLPGFYHIRIAYWSWKGDKNFSFADIPDLDWY